MFNATISVPLQSVLRSSLRPQGLSNNYLRAVERYLHAASAIPTVCTALEVNME